MLPNQPSTKCFEQPRYRLLSAVLFCALPAFAQVQSRSPSDAFPTVRHAATALAAGDSKQAENDLQIILQSNPNDVHALNLLAIIRAQQKRESEAEALFKRAIAIQPDFAGSEAGLGLLYAQMGKDELSIPALQQALRLDPGRRDAQAALTGIWRRQAHLAAQYGDLEKALALLIQARKLNPADADVQYDFGMIALRMSLFSDALDAFSHTLQLRADDSQALYALGRTKMALSRFDDAQQIFQHYIEVNPKDASGHYALGVALESLQRASDASFEFERSINLQPQQTESYLQLGLLELDTGSLDTAEKEFKHVLARSPQHAGALTGMGRVRFQQKRYAEAADFLKKAIASDPELRESHYYLGLTDARMGLKEDSEKELATASRIEHEEVEKHQNVLKILDPSELQQQESKPTQ